MKVYVNRFPKFGPWGGGAKFANSFHKIAPDSGVDIVPPDSVSIVPDVILLVGLDNDGQGISIDQAIMYKNLIKDQHDVKLVLRVNENDARKNTTTVDKMLLKAASYMDATVFVSEWLQDYFVKQGWPTKKNTVIINGVDREIFKPQPKLDNGKINITAHHWSDNEMKGKDIYEQLDKLVGDYPDKLSFTYIGRHKCNFKNTNVIKPLHGKALGEELGKYDVYVSASRFDPGPNHITESISCELPTYVHVDGGGCVEFAGKDHSYQTFDELKKLLLSKDFKPNTSLQFPDWNDCIKEYIGFLETV